MFEIKRQPGEARDGKISRRVHQFRENTAPAKATTNCSMQLAKLAEEGAEHALHWWWHVCLDVDKEMKLMTHTMCSHGSSASKIILGFTASIDRSVSNLMELTHRVNISCIRFVKERGNEKAINVYK